jgi:hypothetical protein
MYAEGLLSGYLRGHQRAGIERRILQRLDQVRRTVVRAGVSRDPPNG